MKIIYSKKYLSFHLQLFNGASFEGIPFSLNLTANEKNLIEYFQSWTKKMFLVVLNKCWKFQDYLAIKLYNLLGKNLRKNQKNFRPWTLWKWFIPSFAFFGCKKTLKINLIMNIMVQENPSTIKKNLIWINFFLELTFL